MNEREKEALAVGLNESPPVNWAEMDICWVAQADGSVLVYEKGILIERRPPPQPSEVKIEQDAGR
jgi:hypothetical protein